MEYVVIATPRAKPTGPRPASVGISFEAADDTEAMYLAAETVLREALTHGEPWRRGAIVLSCGKRIVGKMPSKKPQDVG